MFWNVRLVDRLCEKMREPWTVIRLYEDEEGKSYVTVVLDAIVT